MLLDQADGQITAEGRVIHSGLTQRGLIGSGIKFSSQSAKCPDLENFAVHQVFTGAQTVFLAIGAHSGAVDQLAEHFIKPALGNEFGHRQRSVLLAHLVQCRVRSDGNIGHRNRLTADHRNAVAACNAAKSRSGDIRRSECQRHQAEERKNNRQADFRLEETAEERNHGVTIPPEAG